MEFAAPVVGVGWPHPLLCLLWIENNMVGEELLALGFLKPSSRDCL